MSPVIAVLAVTYVHSLESRGSREMAVAWLFLAIGVGVATWRLDFWVYMLASVVLGIIGVTTLDNAMLLSRTLYFWTQGVVTGRAVSRRVMAPALGALLLAGIWLLAEWVWPGAWGRLSAGRGSGWGLGFVLLSAAEYGSNRHARLTRALSFWNAAADCYLPGDTPAHRVFLSHYGGAASRMLRSEDGSEVKHTHLIPVLPERATALPPDVRDGDG
jgi:hypothetical protein